MNNDSVCGYNAYYHTFKLQIQSGEQIYKYVVNHYLRLTAGRAVIRREQEYFTADKKQRESYAYEITGDCVTDGLSAKQTVLLRYLDFSKMAADLQSSTNECVRLLVERLSKEEIYDANGGYREDFVSHAYADAVEMTLSHREEYYSSDPIELDLIFRNGSWLIQAGPELLSALCGGT